jgi:hypothetical protein
MDKTMSHYGSLVEQPVDGEPLSLVNMASFMSACCCTMSKVVRYTA